MQATWRVKPVPGDPETDYFYGKKRDDPYFRRVIDIRIAIAKSHRDALLVAQKYFRYCSTPAFVSYSSDNPGFVSLRESSRIFVLDNLFAACSISGGDLDQEKIIATFVDDLKNGRDGVYKGTPVEPPSLQYEGKLTGLTFDNQYTLTFPVQAFDPNHRRVRLCAELKNVEYVPAAEEQTPNPKPIVRINQEGQVEIRYKGPSFSADLCVYAVNDLGLMAEPWVQRIQVE